MTTDPIAAARAMIEPLTGYTPKPWAVDMSYQWPSKVRAAPPFNEKWVCDASSALPHALSNARLIAAAPDLRDMVATLADALEAERAEVAAAYEAAAQWHDEAAAHDQGGIYYSDAVGISISNRYELEQSVKAHTCSAYAIRALTPADAQAALDKLLAEARLEGWRAGRDAAARCLEQGADEYSCGCDPIHCRCHHNIEQMRIDAEVVRDLPEPKEDSHD